MDRGDVQRIRFPAEPVLSFVREERDTAQGPLARHGAGALVVWVEDVGGEAQGFGWGRRGGAIVSDDGGGQPEQRGRVHHVKWLFRF
jgi:hypothetical protein